MIIWTHKFRILFVKLPIFLTIYREIVNIFLLKKHQGTLHVIYILRYTCYWLNELFTHCSQLFFMHGYDVTKSNQPHKIGGVASAKDYEVEYDLPHNSQI